MFKKDVIKKIILFLCFSAAIYVFYVLFLCESKSDIDVHLRVNNQSIENIVRLDISDERRIFRVGCLISKGNAVCLYFSDAIPLELTVDGEYENGSKFESVVKIPQRDMIDNKDYVVFLNIAGKLVNADCKPDNAWE